MGMILSNKNKINFKLYVLKNFVIVLFVNVLRL